MDPQQVILEAVKAGDEARVRALVGEHPELAAARTAGGVSIALLAVYYGHPALAEALLAGRAPDIFEAAATGRVERVDELLASDPALANAFAPDGFTPLGLAAYFGQRACAEALLLQGANPNLAARNPTRVQPLHSAVANRDAAAGQALAELLLRHGADANAQQEGGYTPLHEAAFHGEQILAELLLAHGADPRRATDEGQTPFDLAEKHGHSQVAALLRQASERRG
ncbi:MAG: ankyrin repeat domain-containing protein [Anaerolineales bacterium]|nr:ankyrin repeat domain-containing protein [Anaerolineales bacterium]